jgi:hypothetical protein
MRSALLCPLLTALFGQHAVAALLVTKPTHVEFDRHSCRHCAALDTASWNCSRIHAQIAASAVHAEFRREIGEMDCRRRHRKGI